MPGPASDTPAGPGGGGPSSPTPPAPGSDETGYDETTAPITSGWIFPVGSYLRYSNSFLEPRDNTSGIHGAIDIYANRGMPIVAPVSGVVTPGWNSAGGHTFTLIGDDGITYYFAHLDEAVTVSGRVEAGAPIGKVGNSGNATGTDTHLHFKMSKNGMLINPKNFLDNGADAYSNLEMQADGTYSYEPGGGGGAAGGTASDGPITLPTGGTFYTVGGTRYVAYPLKDPSGEAQAWVFYEIPSDIDAPAGESLSQSAWEDKVSSNGWQDAGSADAFSGVNPGTSWDTMIENTLYAMGIYGTDAMEDPEVLAVIALFIARPDMSTDELQNRLDQTAWGQSHTDRQKSWDDKSEAQQEQDIVDQAFSLVGTWFTYTGEAINVMDYDADGDGRVTSAELQAGNPDLFKYALGVANGTMTSREVVETWIKPAALEMDQSPWNRVLDAEEKAQGAQEVGIESNAAKVQQLYRDYGIPISWEEALKIGEEVEMNRMSLAEIEQDLDEQAMALYPGKPAGVKTTTYAQPYIQQYKNLMEVPDVGLDDPLLQSAMSDGMTIGDFSTQLRKDPRWMKTTNARDTHYQTMGQLGRQMGF